MKLTIDQPGEITNGLTEKEIDHFLYNESLQVPQMTFEDYKKNIAKYLVLCSYHYTPVAAKLIVERYNKLIMKEYERGETVGEVADSFGYSCG